MVTLDTTFSKLQSLLQTDITLDELEHILFELGFELDGVEGDEIKVDITPDRIDALSTYGLARILNAYKGEKYQLPKIHDSKYAVNVDKSVEDVRPKTVCAVIDNLNISEETLAEIIWLQEKLHDTIGKKRTKAAIGIYPLDKIQFPIKYCAKKPNDIIFTPLDETKDLNAIEILQKYSAGLAYGHLLEQKKTYPIFVDANNTILSMPPIINSEHAGRVTTDTSAVFIECSGFDEKILNYVLTLLVCAFSDMGGQIHSVKVNAYKTPALDSRQMSITQEDVLKILGVELSLNQIANLLEKMLYTTKIQKDSIHITIPPFRNDIWHIVDIVDDVVRAYGINEIPKVFPKVATQGHKLSENRFMENVTEQLIGFGLQEVRTLGVTDKADQFEKMNLKPQSHIALGSTAERSINMLRCQLLPELLKFILHNQNAQHPLNVFEIGDVVLPDKTHDVQSKNVPTLAVVLCSDTANFTSVKQLIVTLLQRFSCEITCKPMKHDSYIEGRCAQIQYKGKNIGIIGEFSLKVLQNWGFAYPVVGFEISLVELL